MNETMKMRPKTLTALITFLEMTSRAPLRIAAPAGRDVAILRTRAIPLAFYRYLYSEVGRAHHWELRRRMDDKVLSSIVHSPTTRIDVLYVDGCPAGFSELDFSRLPQEVELAYFGLAADFTGQGLGKWFLASAVDSAWDFNPAKVSVHTNTLDHPRALPLYQKAGFVPVGRAQEEVEVWE